MSLLVLQVPVLFSSAISPGPLTKGIRILSVEHIFCFSPSPTDTKFPQTNEDLWS